MKIAIVICAVVVVVAICSAIGCMALSRRSTDATIPLTAKIPGKAAVVYYSQSKVRNTVTVAPFCTHGGGGAGHFAADLRKACPGAKTLDQLVIRGSNQIERRMGLGVSVRHTEDDVVEWLNRIFND